MLVFAFGAPVNESDAAVQQLLAEEAEQEEVGNIHFGATDLNNQATTLVRGTDDTQDTAVKHLMPAEDVIECDNDKEHVDPLTPRNHT